MRSLAAVVTVVGLVALLASFASPAARRTGPVRLADLTLDRSVRYSWLLNPLQSVSITAPANYGFCITSAQSTYGASIKYSIDGNPVGASLTGLATLVGNGLVPLQSEKFDPPIVVRPGQTLFVQSVVLLTDYTNANPSGQTTLSVGGYVLLPDEF